MIWNPVIISLPGGSGDPLLLCRESRWTPQTRDVGSVDPSEPRNLEIKIQRIYTIEEFEFS